MPVGATTASFMVHAVDDSDDDDGESVTLTHATDDAYIAGDIVTITIEDDEVPAITALTATAGNAQVALSWTNPMNTDLDAVRISAIETGVPGTAIDINGAAAGTDLTLDAMPGMATITEGLSNGTTGYTFSIVAVDNKDTGNSYESASCCTPPVTAVPAAVSDSMPPGAVTGINVTAGNAHVVLTWTNPNDADLASVRISATANSVAVNLTGTADGTAVPKDGNNLVPTATPDGSGSVTVTGLTNRTAYTFSIVAVDSSDNASAAVASNPIEPVAPVASIAVTNATITESDAADDCSVDAATTNCTTVTVSLNEAAPTGGVTVMISLTPGGADDATTLTDDYTVEDAVVEPSPFPVTVPATMDEISFTIRAVNDSVGEGDGTLTFALVEEGTDYTVNTTPAMASVVVTIASEDLPGLSIMADPITISEAGGSTTITVSAGSLPLPDSVSVRVSRSSLTTGAGVDVSGLVTATSNVYDAGSALNQDVELSPDAISGEITFTIQGADETISPVDHDNGDMEFEILALPTYTLGTPRTATVTVEDNDVPVASISANNATITESDEDDDCAVAVSSPDTTNCTTVTVSLDIVTQRAAGVTVMVALATGGAAGATTLTDDYTVEGATVATPPFAVTVPQGQSMVSFTVEAVNDIDLEEDGTLTFILQVDPGDDDYTVNTTPAMARTVVTISSEDSRGITSTAGATLVVVEEGLAGSYTLVLTSEPTADVIVELMLAAATGVDIDNLGMTTADVTTPTKTLSLTFNADVAGSNPWNTAQTVTVAMTADDGNSIDETATISYVISGGDYGATETAVTLGDQAVSVTDDDDASVTVMADSSTVSVASGSVTITFTLANPPAGDVTVTVDTPTGSATLGADYTLSATEVILNAGNLEDSITVTATPGSNDDDGETITLSYTVSGGITAPGATSLTITGTAPDPVTGLTATAGDGQVELEWTNPTAADLASLIISATEVISTVTTAVDLTGGTSSISSLAVAVETTSDGNDLKVTATSGMLSGQAGNVTVTGLRKGTEYTFTIVAVDSNDNVSTGEDIAATPADSVAPDPVTGFTATAGDGQVELMWVNPTDVDLASVRISATDSSGAVDISGSTGDGSNDLVVTAPAVTVTVTGLPNDTEYTFTIVAVDSSDNESASCCTSPVTATPLDMTAPGPVTGFGATIGDRQVVLNWTNPGDTDLASVTISAIASGAAVNLTGTSGGSPVAKDGNNLTPPATFGTSGSVTVTGLANGTAYRFTIVAVDSSANESSEEMITAFPAAPLRDSTAPDPVTNFDATAGDGEVELSWTNPGDADFASVRISATDSSGAVDLTGGTSSISSLAVSVETTSDGNDLKVTVPYGVLSGQAGDVTVTGLTNGTAYRFTIVAVDISDNESTEEMAIATPRPLASIAVNNSTITEKEGTDDCAVAVTSPDTTNCTTVTVSLSEDAPTGGVEVMIGFTVGGAAGATTLGDDYTVTVTGATVTAPPSSFAVTVLENTDEISFTIRAVNDDDVEGDGTLTFALQTGTGYTVNQTPAMASAVVTIISDDIRMRGVTSTAGATLSVVEQGAAGSYTLVLDREPTEDVMIELVLSADPGVDITNLGMTTAGVPDPTKTLTLTFNADVAGSNPWSTAQTVTVEMATDDGNSIDETAAITYTITGGDYGAVTLGEQAVSVTDDDEASVTVMEDSSTVSVAPDGVTVSFTLANPPAGDVRVTVNTPTGSATLGADYTLSATEVILNAGNLVDSITVTATPGSSDDDGETITLSYTVSGGISAPGATSLTIAGTAPGPVTGFTATAGNRQVTLSWTNPNDTDLASLIISATEVIATVTTAVDLTGGTSSISDLAVAVETTSDGDDLKVTATSGMLSGQAGNVTVTGLTNDTEYTFTIVAVDSSDNASTEETAPPVTPIFMPSSVSLLSDVAVDDDFVVFTVQLDADNRPAADTDIEVTVELTGDGARGVTGGTTQMVTINWVPSNPEASSMSPLILPRDHGTIGLDGTITATVQDDPGPNPPAPNPNPQYVVGSDPMATTSTALKDTRPTFEIGSVSVGDCEVGGTTAIGIMVMINRLGNNMGEVAIPLTIESSGSGGTSSIDAYTQPVDPGTGNVGVPSGTGTTVNVCHHLKDNYPGGDDVTATIDATDTVRVPSDSEPATQNTASGSSTGMVTVRRPPEASIAVSDATITESDEFGDCPETSCATVTVSLSENAPTGGLPVMVGLTAGGAAGAATLGEDYIVRVDPPLPRTASSFTVTVLQGQRMVSFIVEALNDDDVEEDGTVTLALQPGGTSYTVNTTPTMASVVITISSDDVASMLPEASIAVNNVTITENAFDDCSDVDLSSSTTSCTTVTVSLSENAPTGPMGGLPVMVGLAASGADGAATLREDYMVMDARGDPFDPFNPFDPSAPFTVIVRTGTDEITFTIRAVNDSVGEGDGILTFALHPGTDYSVTTDPTKASVIMVTIASDDPPSVSIMADPTTISEDGSATTTITISASPPIPATEFMSGTVSVRVSRPPLTSGPGIDMSGLVTATSNVVYDAGSDAEQEVELRPDTMPSEFAPFEEISFEIVGRDETSPDPRVDHDNGEVMFRIIRGDGYMPVPDIPGNPLTATATVTIEDNDVPVASIAVNNAAITESDDDDNCAVAVSSPTTTNCTTVTVSLDIVTQREDGVPVMVALATGGAADATHADR